MQRKLSPDLGLVTSKAVLFDEEMEIDASQREAKSGSVSPDLVIHLHSKNSERVQDRRHMNSTSIFIKQILITYRHECHIED